MQPFKYNPKFNSGAFRHKITFQSFNDSQTENGFDEQIWRDLFSCWADIKTLRTREFYAAAEKQNENSIRFIIRFRKDIKSSMRVMYKEKFYEIIGDPINDDMKNKTLTIHAKEVVADGG
jgi:SPP1 family predicted phage head-tail adaptor